MIFKKCKYALKYTKKQFEIYRTVLNISQKYKKKIFHESKNAQTIPRLKAGLGIRGLREEYMEKFLKESKKVFPKDALKEFLYKSMNKSLKESLELPGRIPGKIHGEFPVRFSELIFLGEPEGIPDKIHRGVPDEIRRRIFKAIAERILSGILGDLLGFLTIFAMNDEVSPGKIHEEGSGEIA